MRQEAAHIRLMDQERIPIVMKLQEPVDPVNVRFFGPNAIMFEANAFADFLQETLNLGWVQAVGIGHEIPPKVAYPGMWQMKSLPERDLFTACLDCIP